MRSIFGACLLVALSMQPTDGAVINATPPAQDKVTTELCFNAAIALEAVGVLNDPTSLSISIFESAKVPDAFVSLRVECPMGIAN
jgi:hypothetical protein